MPRQIDLFPNNLQVDHNPLLQLGATTGQIQNLIKELTDLPALTLEAIEAGITQWLTYLKQATGLDLLAFWNQVKPFLDAFIKLFGELDPASGSFDPVAAVLTFFNLVASVATQFPGALVDDLVALWGGSASALPQEIIDAIIGALGGSGTGNPLSALTAALEAIPQGNIVDLVSDLAAAGSQLAQEVLDAIVNDLTGGTGTGNPISALTTPLQDLLNGNSPLNVLNLIGQIPAELFSLIPASAIGGSVPNLLTNPLFDGANSLNGQSIWSWVGSIFPIGTGATTPGSASVTANGSLLTLLANLVPVTQGQTLNLSVQALWNNIVGSGSPIQLVLQTFSDTLGNNFVASNLISSLNPTAGASPTSWAGAPTGAKQGTLTGTYTVPSGVQSVRMGLQVTSGATAGTVWFGNALQQLTNLMPNSLMSGIENTIGEDLQSVVDLIHNGITGGSSTGNPLSTIESTLASFFGGSGIGSTSWTSLLSSLFGGSSIGSSLQTSAIPNITKSMSTDLQSLIDAIANVPTGGSTTGNPITAAENAVGGIVTGIFNFLTGSSATAATQTDANNALQAQATTTAANSTAIAALQATQSSQQNSGASAAVDFSAYANGSMPSSFTKFQQIGTGTVAINNGSAVMTPTSGNPVQIVELYNSMTTLTDYQRINVVCSTGSGNFGFPYNNAGAVMLVGRSNSAGTSYVYATADHYGVFIGAMVSNVNHNFANSNAFAFVPNASYQLVCGITGSANTYELFCNGSSLLSYQDTGNVATVGSSNRYAGFGFSTPNDGGSYPATPQVASWAVADNAPPAVVGSGFRQYRTSTSTVAGSSNSGVLLPNSFFDTNEYNTPDLTSAPGTANKLTVSVAGWYAVTVCLFISANTGSSVFGPVVYQNGILAKWGTTVGGVNSGSASGTFLLYCAVGDYIQPGYISSGAISLTGDATGTRTYWEVALMNVSTMG